MVYYNEIDEYAAAWLKNLIDKNLIAKGDVDTRSIENVSASDLKGYTQCHFFAGIGIWSYSLRLAGWDDNREVWTGSCPCQPFSSAGKRERFNDKRHLWPEFARLIGKCNPSTVFGEQIASKDGRDWFNIVRSDLETMGYGVGAADLCAAGVGAPHIRQRLFWVADTQCGGFQSGAKSSSSSESEFSTKDSGMDSGNTTRSYWSNADWLYCISPTDEKRWRPVEPGTFPMAHGLTNRMGRLRAYGNAIVPQVAQKFIESYMEI